jgi:glucose-1-phosphate thymidylyltransferase
VTHWEARISRSPKNILLSWTILEKYMLLKRKGIILAGGSGTRLHPVTLAMSKQLLPVYDKPMIYYPISTLIYAGVDQLLIICKKDDHISFKKLLGVGDQFGISIQYKIQDAPKGLAHGLLLAADFVGADNFWFILGDNLFDGPDFGIKLKRIKDTIKSSYFI